MSAAALPGPKDGLRVSTILDAYLRLDKDLQETVRERVKAATSPGTPEAERRRAESAIEAALRLGREGGQPGRVLGKEERLSAEHQALRQRLDQEESVFAANLARLLGERQLTQAELARRVGVGQPAISMMLARKCRPHWRTVGKIAAALGVTVEELWPGKAGPDAIS
jgi:DNA-binding XRE family transcriptional regulator